MDGISCTRDILGHFITLLCDVTLYHRAKVDCIQFELIFLIKNVPVISWSTMCCVVSHDGITMLDDELTLTLSACRIVWRKMKDSAMLLCQEEIKQDSNDSQCKTFLNPFFMPLSQGFTRGIIVWDCPSLLLSVHTVHYI